MAAHRLREEWKHCHQVKAEALGFEIDVESLESDLSSLALEFRLAAEVG